jgi:hypothetical protein
MIDRMIAPLIAAGPRAVRGFPRGVARAAIAAGVVLAASGGWTPSHANNYGESGSWAFETPADQANLAVVQDMIQKKQSGAYGPATATYNYYTNYNSSSTSNTSSTSIGHQTNCTVTATATGNSGTGSAVAASPSTAGASASSAANSSSATSQPGYSTGAVSVGASQANYGSVGSSVNGATTVSSGGGNYQALNSTQSNNASQTASIKSSTACAYGALN